MLFNRVPLIPVIKISCIVLLVFSLACSERSAEKKKNRLLVTSIFPVYDIARNIAGNEWTALFVVPQGANPHTYEPSPSVVAELSGADLFIGIDPGFDGWIEKYLPPESKRYYIDLARKEGNPHVWLSLKNAGLIVRYISRRLAEADPGNDGRYAERAASYIGLIDREEARIQEMLSPYKGAVLIQWHPAWNYFASDYGLNIIETIESGHGHEPSVRKFRDMAVKARKEGARYILAGLNVRSNALEALKKEIGAEVIKLDSIGGPGLKNRSTYLDLMHYNAKQLAESLKNRAGSSQ